MIESLSGVRDSNPHRWHQKPPFYTFRDANRPPFWLRQSNLWLIQTSKLTRNDRVIVKCFGTTPCPPICRHWISSGLSDQNVAMLMLLGGSPNTQEHCGRSMKTLEIEPSLICISLRHAFTESNRTGHLSVRHYTLFS